MLAEVLDARLHALWDPAAAEDRLAAASEIIDLARAAGDDARERLGMFWRFVALMELGRVAEAESALAAFERAAQLAGDEAALVMVTARHAMLAAMRGRFGESLRLAERVLESGRRAGLADTTDLYGAVRAMVLLEQGTPQEAAFMVELLLDAARHRPGHLFEATLAGVLATFGGLPEAGTELQRVLPQALGASGPRWLGAMTAMAVAASATGDQEAAVALYAALAPYRERLVIQGGANAAPGPVPHYLGCSPRSWAGKTKRSVSSPRPRPWPGRSAPCRLWLTRGPASLTRWPHAPAPATSRPPGNNAGKPGPSLSGWA